MDSKKHPHFSIAGIVIALIGLFMTVLNELTGAILFQITADLGGYRIVHSGGTYYLTQSVFSTMGADYIYISTFYQISMLLGVLLIAIGVIVFFVRLNKSMKESS